MAQNDLHLLLSSNGKASDSLTNSEQSLNEEDSSQIIVDSIKVNCYVVAKVTTEKHCFKQFVGKVLAGLNSDKDYTTLFFVRFRRFKNGFAFPEKEDTASVSKQEILNVLLPPIPIATTQRLSELGRFAVNLSTVE